MDYTNTTTPYELTPTGGAVTITVLPVTLSLVRIPKHRLSHFAHPIIKLILSDSTSSTFLNISTNASEVSIIAREQDLSSFVKIARKDNRRIRRQIQRNVRKESESSATPSSAPRSGQESGAPSPVRPSPRSRRERVLQPVEVSSSWSALQIDSHGEQLGDASARIREISWLLAGISILYQSSYTTDYIFVQSRLLPEVLSILSNANFLSLSSIPSDLSSQISSLVSSSSTSTGPSTRSTSPHLPEEFVQADLAALGLGSANGESRLRARRGTASSHASLHSILLAKSASGSTPSSFIEPSPLSPKSKSPSPDADAASPTPTTTPAMHQRSATRSSTMSSYRPSVTILSSELVVVGLSEQFESHSDVWKMKLIKLLFFRDMLGERSVQEEVLGVDAGERGRERCRRGGSESNLGDFDDDVEPLEEDLGSGEASDDESSLDYSTSGSSASSSSRSSSNHSFHSTKSSVSPPSSPIASSSPTSPTSPSPTDQQDIGGKTVSQCDEELIAIQTVQKQLERRVVLLCRQRNTIAPINNLPPELLVTIMEIALDCERGPYEAWLDQESLQHVCRYWNDLVNNTPSLWAHIRKDIGTPKAMIIRALKKSKDYPLDIRTRSYTEPRNQEAFLGAIVPHAHRWRKASFFLYKSGDGVKPMTTLSTPLLESISLSTDINSTWTHDKPLNIFKDQRQTRLREVFLDGVPIPWSPTVLCNLNALGISRIPKLGPSFDQVLAVLVACPGLESLAIQDVKLAGGNSAVSHNTIHMPTLSRLDLNIEPEKTKRLLATIRAPNCKSGSLQCEVAGDPMETLFTPDISHFFDRIRSGVDSVSFECHCNGFMMGWRGSWRIRLRSFRVRVSVAKGTLNWLRALSAPNSPVVRLDAAIGTGDPYAGEDIIAVMADMGGLHQLAFIDGALIGGTGLRSLATRSLAKGSTHGPFPDLEEMWIDYIKGDDWENLLDMLRRRRGEIDARGGVQPPKPLRKLEFGARHPSDWETKISNFKSIYWPNRVEEVRKLLGPEGELVWCGRTVTEDGDLEHRPTH
ncbi:hypothetical protein FS837_012553 [Tulasnella sp. UAMH 9824]|nr:hypothetical protein FS837_012553 [Tulasnella sp. UAMH 9824]